MIEIDGSKFEGGGQIIRTATALSVITGKPCYIFNIRKGRKTPGLRAQHLCGIKALTQLSSAETEGVSMASEEILFQPKKIFPQNLGLDIKTAGSITLALQSIIPPCLYSDKTIEASFRGGATDTFFSPPIDYFRNVFLEIIKKMGAKVEIEIIKRGFYPEGGAKVKAKIFPSHLKSISLTERGKLERITIISGATLDLKEKKVAERQVSGVKQVLGKLKLPLEEKIDYYPAEGKGSQVNIVAEMENTVFGTNNLGKIGKSAEEVGKEAAEDFLKEVSKKACLDKHMADQILPFMALAQGESRVTVSEVTRHCETNMWVVEKFIKGKFTAEGKTISWR